uniref:Putative secreted protein n=1 Tax=Ixodes ricinus TaxID=34613 RepID=A0A6B0UQI1_IXORI
MSPQRRWTRPCLFYVASGTLCLFPSASKAAGPAVPWAAARSRGRRGRRAGGRPEGSGLADAAPRPGRPVPGCRRCPRIVDDSEDRRYHACSRSVRSPSKRSCPGCCPWSRPRSWFRCSSRSSAGWAST